MTTNRREFLQGAAATAAAAVASTYARADGANNRLHIGLIGPGGMGTHHLDSLVGRDDLEITFVCDPDTNRLAAAAKRVTEKSKQSPKAVKDMREVLDQKEIDAVFIATPDHWHAPATILACDAGKHVYVEKPCCHNLREGRLMTEAARRANKVVQTGTQSRSTQHVMEAIELLKSGIIGDVLVCRVWNSQLRRNIGKTKPSDPPKYLDYDLWVGPAPMTPYRSNMLPGIWRWWYDFGCGDIGNDGVHDIDIGRWGLGVETHPSSIAAIGGKYFFDDDQQFPDTQTVIFEYPGDGKLGHRKQLIFEQRIWSPYVEEGHENGNAFYGTKGYMILGKGSGWQVFGRKNVPGRKGAGKPDLKAHHQNFFDCIRNGGKPNADVEIGHHSAALCHLANIATRMGRILKFDPANEKIIGDPEANALLHRKYREGHWAAPKGV